MVSRPVRAPGTIKLDEPRVSVISARSHAYIGKVENITTGDRVRKRQLLLRLYSHEIAAASAQYVSVGSTRSDRCLHLGLPLGQWRLCSKPRGHCFGADRRSPARLAGGAESKVLMVRSGSVVWVSSLVDATLRKPRVRVVGSVHESSGVPPGSPNRATVPAQRMCLT